MAAMEATRSEIGEEHRVAFGRHASVFRPCRERIDRTRNAAEYRAAFGRHTGVSRSCRERIDCIKNNDPDFVDLTLQAGVANQFSDLSWNLLGRYIAENDHLESIHFRTSLLNDSNVSSLFKDLSKGSRSLRKVVLANTTFGIDGVKSLASFLKNSQLTMLEICQNEHVTTECFRSIIDALGDGSIEALRIRGCENVDSLDALEHYTLPHLRLLNVDQNNVRTIPSLERYSNLERLSLEGNWIGRRGYPSVAKLLRKESPPVRSLDLTFTGMRDPEAELIASSLKHNTSLNHLRLEGNKITEEGRRAFLKLLNDVSSIRGTSNSNHSLRSLELPRSFDLGAVTMFNHIDLAININKAYSGNSNAASRVKVVETQLCSHARMELSGLQLVDYCYTSLFPQIEPVFLPNVLAMVGNEHGQSELYRMLNATVSDLASIVNRKIALKERMTDNESRINAMNTEFTEKKKDLLAEYERQLAALSAGAVCQTAALAAENAGLQKELESMGEWT